MSDNGNEISFEDAIRKIETTNVNPAIPIENLGEQYFIPDAPGKWIQFVFLAIADKKIPSYWLKYCLIDKLGKQDCHLLIPHIDSKHYRKDSGFFDITEGKNPLFIPNGISLVVSVVPAKMPPNAGFEYGGSLVYRFLGG